MTTKQNSKLHVQQPMIFSPEVLAERQTKAIDRYKGSHAACQAVDEPILLLYTKKVVELLADGYSLNEKLPCRSGPNTYAAYFSKPAAMQEADIEALKSEIEEALKSEIEAFNAEQESILAEQLYQAQVAKERKAAEEKEQKAREAAKKEAADYFASIKEGK
ncbi:hypothetical protein [Stutzerimonas kunmingensis]|jgi:hypothetical protein|uniref:hypothetical protein n=1 Tax=Stutzerimonas kunmingensis TaxID=1211807 RepID=UPI00241F451F|nr:hypothetical protein [Stutzerimonas kunmingensis]|tara:strand:+ start:6222 stop:6707 length:486 start_codon:yes stop_codon:yes gene_type:complete